MNDPLEHNLVELHVEELAPPEPMMKILQALVNLPPQHLLKVHHRREPFPLYEKLAANGWCYHCIQLDSDNFHIFIFRLEDQALFSPRFVKD